MVRCFTCHFIAVLLSTCIWLSPEAQARDCRNGVKVGPETVGPTYAIPQGKILCRQFGSTAYIPAAGKDVGGDPNPPCGDTARVYATEEAKYIDAMKATGSAMVATFSPWTAGVGLIVVGAAYVWQSQLPGKTSNCAISQIVLSKDQEVVHFAAEYGNNVDTETTPQGVTPHAVDFPLTPRVDFTAYYSDLYFRVQGLPPLDVGTNQKMYSILFKNWATQTDNFRHARILIYWVE